MLSEGNKSGDSSLRDWFSKSKSSDGTTGWVQLGGKYAGKPCAKQPGQTTKPKCGSSKMKRNLNKDEEEAAFRRKNRQDPNPDRRGKAKNVATEAKEELRYCPKCKKAEKRSDCAYGTSYWDNNAEPITVEEGKKDACYHKVKSRYKVWPSAYASGVLVKCRKKGADNWGNSTKKEEFSPAQIAALEANGFVELDEAGKKCWKGYKKAGTQKLFGKTYNRCVKEGSFTIDPKSHKKAQKDQKIRNMTQSPNENEAAVARKKARGPELYGENITIEDANGNTFAEVIDVIKNPLVSESCCSKCGKEPCECGTKRYRGGSAAKPGSDKNYVKPMGEEIEEAVRLPAKTGNIVAVNFGWRGRYYSIRIFFPHTKVPNKAEVQNEISKVYPGAKVYNFMVSDYEPGQPLLQATNEDWQKVNKKDKTDGMSPAAVKAYRRENPGSKLKTAVTGNPKKGSKDAKRRKSYCARSKGQQDMHNISCSKTPDKPVCKARRRWKC